MKDPNEILKQAVEDIVQSINHEGLTPHAAVVKTAKVHDLNIHFIKRASEAINVALTHSHFKSNPGSKDQDFPIVDAEKVASEIFGQQAKTAEENKSEWYPTTNGIDVNFNKLSNPKTKKAMEELVCNSEKHDSFELSEKAIFEKCAHYISNLEKHVDALQTKQGLEKHAVTSTFSNIIASFAKAAEYRAPFETFERQVVNAFGKTAEEFVNLIYHTCDLDEKRADFNETTNTSAPVEQTQLFSKLMGHVVEFNKVSQEVAAAEATFEEDRMKVKQAFLDLHNARKAENTSTTTPAPEMPAMAAVPQPSEDPVMVAAKAKMDASNEVLDESFLTPGQRRLPRHLKRAIINKNKKKIAELDPLMKEAFLGDMVKSLISHADAESKPESRVSTNSHSDNLDRKLMLQEMMLFDPILSTMEPHKVGDLYNQFMRIAPELSKEKEIVRSSLRTMAQGQGIDPFTANSYIETNSNVLKQRKLMEGNPVERRN